MPHVTHLGVLPLHPWSLSPSQAKPEPQLLGRSCVVSPLRTVVLGACVHSLPPCFARQPECLAGVTGAPMSGYQSHYSPRFPSMGLSPPSFFPPSPINDGIESARVNRAV
jgi:hypothetical protein